MSKPKAIAVLMVAAVLVVSVAVVFAQANAMPVGANAGQAVGSHGYGMMQQHHAANPWGSMQNGFGYMYRMFMGWCRRF